MIREVSIEDIDFIRGGGYTVPACINVCYKYTDPEGVLYEKKQKAKLFWDKLEPDQRIRWREILKTDREICVLISKKDFSKSYLPLCEEYCIRYNKPYVVHFVYLFEDMII